MNEIKLKECQNVEYKRSWQDFKAEKLEMPEFEEVHGGFMATIKREKFMAIQIGQDVTKNDPKETDDIHEDKNIWLSNIVKEKYLKGFQLPYNDGNMPTSYEIMTMGNIAIVSYSWYSLMYPDEGGNGYLGYADEDMCYW